MPPFYKSYPISSVTECATMEESLADLPPNILSDIFSRLPIKSLLACRSVCKTFLNITSSNPYFTSLHSSKTALNLIIHFGAAHNHNPSNFVHLVDSGLDDAFVSGKPVGFKRMFQISNYPARYPYFDRLSLLPGKENNYFLVDSCDGLLYFAERNVSARSFVCNPITNEYVSLVDFDEERNGRQLTMGMWFGCSRGESQYKVLRIFSTLTGRPYEMGFKHQFCAQVHVVGSSSWRAIEDQAPSVALTWDTSFTVLNGTVYWLCQYTEGSKFIIWFDFQQEKFGDIQPPLGFGTAWLTNQQRMSIGVLGGRLSVTVNTESLHIWALKTCNGKMTWTKQIVIDTSMHMVNHLIQGPLKPLQMLSDSLIIMMRPDLLLVCYDTKKKTFQYIRFDGYVAVFKSVMLKPSFVPLKDALKVDSAMVQSML